MSNAGGITAKEYDGIIAALKARPREIDNIAAEFNRSHDTINTIRQRAGIDRRRG